MTRLNDFVGYFLVAVVVLAPIPLGGNPPIFWAISGTVIGLVAAIYFWQAARSERQLRFPVRSLGLAGVLWLLTALWLVIQVLPLGAILGPFDFVSAAGAVVQSQTLSLSADTTWMMLIRNVSYGLLFLLAAQAGVNEGRAKKVLTAVFWAIVVHAVFGLFQLTQLGDTIIGFEKTAYQGNATGTFVNRNSYATFLAIGLSLGSALIVREVLSERQRNETFGNIAAPVLTIMGGMAAIMIALIASQSRMGSFAALVGMLSVALLALRWIKLSWLTITVAVVLLLVGGASAYWVFGQGLLERLIGVGGSAAGRGEIYDKVYQMILARPLLGYGGGTFELAFPLFYGPPLSVDIIIDKAHSTYLTLVAELGLGALLPIGAMVVLFLRLVWRFWTQRSGAAVLLAGIGAILVGATHSIVDFSLEIQANAYLLTIVMGLAIAQEQRKK